MTTHAGTTQNALGQPAQVERLGRYRLLARLGQGGMGTIHLAVAGGLADFRKLLVVKELRPELTSNEHFVQMFLAEAKVAARLQHPNIVQTLEAGQDGERYFLAMEFLDGQPLSELLKRGAVEPAVPVGMRIQILCEVLAGLHYAHELCDFDDTPFQIVHRDVNPQNVFITYHGHVKLVDFGIAKVVDSELCTTAGVFKGKFPYAAPEQVDCRTVDRRVDVFAVGVMLWEILAQKRFAPGQPTMAGIDARLAGTEPRIAEALPGVDPELAAICDRAMHVDPAQRFASAEAFRAELLAYLAARDQLATPAEIAELLRKKFETERATIHRLISTQVQQLVPDEEFGDSLVRVLTRAGTNKPSPVASDEPITGSDPAALRTLRERPAGNRQRESSTATQSQRLMTQRKRRKARNRRFAMVAAAATLAFGGAYVWVRTETAALVVPVAGSQPMAAMDQAVTVHEGPGAQQLAAAESESAKVSGLASQSTHDAVAQDGLTSLNVKAAPGKAGAAPGSGPTGKVASAERASGKSAAGQTSAAVANQMAAASGRVTAVTERSTGDKAAAALQAKTVSTQPAAEEARVARTAASKAQAAAHAGSREPALHARSLETNAPEASAQRALEVGDDMRLMRRARTAPARTLEDPFR